MKKITAKNYKKDKLYPRVTRAVHTILQHGNEVSPIDLLIELQRLTKKQVEDWRFGRIPYLERVMVGNLSKLHRILRILEYHARAMGLKESQTVYHRWGKGKKHLPLRFSKYRNAGVERAYSRHYVSKRAAGESNRAPEPSTSAAANTAKADETTPRNE